MYAFSTNLFRIMSFSLGMTVACSSVFADDIQLTEESLNKNSLNIITEGLSRSPLARHDSKVSFRRNLRKEEIADWAYNRNIDVLTLEGTFSVGDQQVSVFLGDLASFDAPLADVIESQLKNYHKTAISDIINDLIDKHKVEKIPEKKSNLGRQIADLHKVARQRSHVARCYDYS